MVDLAKIRRKAKEKKAAEATQQETAVPNQAEAPAAPPEPADPTPAAPDALRSLKEPPPELQPAEAPVELSEKLAAFKQTAGRRRRGDEDQGEVEEAAAVLELLLFRIAGEQYALPIETIVEIARPRATTRVPNADESVLGILSLRGTIVTILDVRRRLGHPSEQRITDDTRVIVVEYRGETCGFVVDRVSRVIRIAPSELENHPVVTSSEQSEFIRGVFQHAQRLSILLDMDRLLRF